MREASSSHASSRRAVLRAVVLEQRQRREATLGAMRRADRHGPLAFRRARASYCQYCPGGRSPCGDSVDRDPVLEQCGPGIPRLEQAVPAAQLQAGLGQRPVSVRERTDVTSVAGVDEVERTSS